MLAHVLADGEYVANCSGAIRTLVVVVIVHLFADDPHLGVAGLLHNGDAVQTCILTHILIGWKPVSVRQCSLLTSGPFILFNL